MAEGLVENPPPTGDGRTDYITFAAISVKLDGTNYLIWSRSIFLTIAGRGLTGHINGTFVKPNTPGTTQDKWISNDSLVMSFLLNSMQPHIAKGYLLLDTAAQIWSAARNTYGQLGNDAQMYELRKRVHDTTQKEMTVSQYYAELRSLWQELDHYSDYHPTNAADIAAYRNHVDKIRVYDFLAGLNVEYDQIRVQVLSRIPFPTLEQSHALVHSEESRRAAMLQPSTIDRSALQTSVGTIAKSGSFSRFDDTSKEVVKCEHCHRPYHTKATCWKLHGKPADFEAKRAQRKSKNKANHVDIIPTTPTTDIGLSQEELQAFRRLLKTSAAAAASSTVANSSSSSSASNLATSGSFFGGFSTSIVSSPWIIDTGATDHMTGSSSLFYQYTPTSGKDKVRIADGTLSSIAGKGTINCSSTLPLSSVLHVPSFSTNLLSISSLTRDLNCKVTFFPSYCVFQDLATEKEIGYGKLDGGLYLLEGSGVTSTISSTPHQVHSALTDLHQWHCRLGHPPLGTIEKIFPSLVSACNKDEFFCEACVLAKQTRSTYLSSNNKSCFPFHVIHTDVWGPSRRTSISGHRWFVTFIDCYSRTTWVYLLKHKSDVLYCFQNFHKMIQTQFNATVKTLRSDNGTEYTEGQFQRYLSDHGIIHQTSCVDTPAQNGVAERKNRHLLEVARSLMFARHVPAQYWSDAILTATYLINRMPTRVLDFRTPIAALQGSSTFILPPKIFGCVCYARNTTSKSKLEPRGLRCIFLGYSATQKGYKCYHPPSRRTIVSMDVIFHESNSYYSAPPLQGECPSIEVLPGVELLPIPDVPRDTTYPQVVFDSSPYQEENNVTQQEDSTVPQGEIIEQLLQGEITPVRHTIGDIQRRFDNSETLKTYRRRNLTTNTQVKTTDTLPNQSSSPDPDSTTPGEVSHFDLPIALRKGIRTCTQHPISHVVSYDSLSTSYRTFVSSLSSISIPQNWQAAFTNEKWKAAMVEEMHALKKNDTWDLVVLPPGKQPVGCKWVFVVKQNMDGTVDRYKARLVAKGFTQTYGIDYQETFAPVAKLNTVRVILSYAVNQGWDLQQLDVKNAFLHGDLEEEVYMEIPPGFTCDKTQGKVCKLKRALYGLKQSPRAWFGRFQKAMISVGYKQSNADHTLFVKKLGAKVTILIVYVDDIVVTGNDCDEISRLKKFLGREFEIKDLGKLRYFLGIEVARSSKGIFLSQRKYVLDLLTEVGLLGCYPSDTPIEANTRLREKDGDPVDKGRYQRLVGKLIYLSHTRPDIAFAVSLVSQFMHDPYSSHMNAVFRILRYLKSTPGKGILLSPHDNLKVEAYTDADWAGSPDRKSISGYCTFLGGNLVTWRSKKQNVVARSSAEAEFRAMAQGVCELLWLRGLLEDLGVSVQVPMMLYCDNKAAISIAHNPVQHDRTKHVEIDRHFIKEKLENGLICMPFVQSGDQLADVFTKGLGGKSFHPILVKLGMCDIYAPT